MEGFYRKKSEARELLAKERIIFRSKSLLKRKGKARGFITQIAYSYEGDG